MGSQVCESVPRAASCGKRGDDQKKPPERQVRQLGDVGGEASIRSL
jgi:hypothetical protein